MAQAADLSGELKVGDFVRWRSQNKGVWTWRHGEIVKVIPKMSTPDPRVFPGVRYDTSALRKYKSYVVRADNGAHYWPRVSGLERI